MSAIKKNKDIDLNGWIDLSMSDDEVQQLLDKPSPSNMVGTVNGKLCTDEANKGFDKSLGDSWIYPSNLPCRSYQLNIAEKAIYRNTLVVLPTGLGKTFIAAVLMYNIYRWYPNGKVIFMAPTRPLVNQQIEACQNIMPFPNQDTVEITGKLPKAKRNELWQTKRVFFVTPQVVQSDICPTTPIHDFDMNENYNSNCNSNPKTEFPFENIKLLVIDEAHRAKGRYAYTEVVQTIAQKIKYFRVLALTATPGRSMDDVAEICRNLLISHIEVRCDNSIDVQPYIHRRRIETVVVELSEQIKSLREQMLRIIDPYLRQLSDDGVISGSLGAWNRNSLLYEHKHFRDYCERNGRHTNYAQVNTNFSICISLYHALELLERHGVQAFLHNFEEDIEGKDKFILKMDPELRDMIDRLKHEMADTNPFNISTTVMTNGQIAEIPRNLDFGHPKFQKAQDCLLKHFKANENSRAIVFCEYRESVMLIHRLLLQQKPLLRAKCFVGQGSTSGHLKALTQKQQLQIMQEFRAGKCNILIATSIGEEGIDVGEVDLIVCFDISTSNPTRFIQRIGRTGRQKNGNVVMLVTAGREQQLLKDVMANKDYISKKIHNAPVVKQALYKGSPRLVPTEFQPQCVHTYVTITNEPEANSMKQKKKKTTNLKKPNNSPAKGMQDMRKFLKRKSDIIMDSEDAKYFEIDQAIEQQQPNTQTRKIMEQSFQQMQSLFKDLNNPSNTQLTTTTNDRNDNDDRDDQPLQVEVEIKKAIRDNPKYIRKLNRFLKTDFCTDDVLKRSEINDIVYHLKSRQMSKEMKLLLLRYQPDVIKTNFKQMEILKVLDQTNNQLLKDSTADEILIREINSTIIDLFGSVTAVESFLNDIDEKPKNNGEENSETFSSNFYECKDEMSANEMLAFQQELNEIFKDCDDYGPLYDNFDIIKSELCKTVDYEKYIRIQQTDNLNEIESSIDSIMKLDISSNDDDDDFNDIRLMEKVNEATSTEQSSSKCSNNYELIACSQNYRISNDNSSTPKPLNQNQFHKDYEIEEYLQSKVNVDNNTENYTKQYEGNLNLAIKQQPINEEQLITIPTTTTCILDALKSTSIIMNTPPTTTTTTETSPENSNGINHNSPFRQTELNEIFDESDLFNITDEIEEELAIASTKTTTTTTTAQSNLTQKSVDSELEIDMDLFLQPMPEESLLLLNNTNSPKRLSSRTTDKGNLQPPTPQLHSPDLFNVTGNSSNSLIVKDNINEIQNFITSRTSITKNLTSNSPKPITLSAKLSAKLQQKTNHRDESKTILKQYNDNILNSPTNRRPIIKGKFEKSPNLFELYIQNTHGKGKLPGMNLQKSVKKSSCQPTEQAVIDSPTTSSSIDSPIRRSEGSSKSKVKRKIVIDSDTDEEFSKICDEVNRKESFERIVNDDSENRTELNDSLTELNHTELQLDGFLDSEQILPPSTQTQSVNLRCQRNKRRHFNSFIQHEAVSCGRNANNNDDDDDDDDDDFEETLDKYKFDSIVINSDDDDVVTTSATQIQAMYLQSVKSPQCRLNAFKIPAKRQFMDASTVFSQEVQPDDFDNSQYISDSFIVDDAAVEDEKLEDTSLCPLERAEKILKARKRAKRRLNNHNNQKRQRIQQIISLVSSSSSSSSSASEDEFI